MIELLEDVGLQTLSENVSDAVSSLKSGDQHQEVSIALIYCYMLHKSKRWRTSLSEYSKTMPGVDLGFPIGGF